MNAKEIIERLVTNSPVETPEAPPTTKPVAPPPSPTRPQLPKRKETTPDPFRRRDIKPEEAPRPKAKQAESLARRLVLSVK